MTSARAFPDLPAALGRYGLAGAYLTGQGVRRNQKKAIALLNQAAEQEEETAIAYRQEHFR